MFVTDCVKKEALHDHLKEVACIFLCTAVHVAEDVDHIWWWQLKSIKLISSSDYAQILKLVKQAEN